MASRTVTWVYFDTVSAMNRSPTSSNASQREIDRSDIIGREYDGVDGLDPIDVRGNNVQPNRASDFFQTTYNASRFQPASEFIYTPTDGSAISGVKVSAFLDTTFELVYNDEAGDQITVEKRGVIIQMTNGDLFMRPALDTRNAWAGIGDDADSSIVSIKILSAKPFSDNSVPATISFDPTTGAAVVVPCFGRGTMIDTPDGVRAVEDLRAGDMVLTRDHGPQPIRWVGASTVSAAKLDLMPNLRPIRIRAGALDAGVPERDLIVSPQHRVLVSSRIARRMFDGAEVLIAAKHLLGMDGIEIADDLAGVDYFHLLLDGHQILISDGAETESLYLGTEARKAVGPKAMREIQALFPDLADATAAVPQARNFASGKMGRKLAMRQARNHQPLVMH